MSGARRVTSKHNKELLTKELGLKQISNTSLFRNVDLLVFPPSSNKNAKGNYWFNIREVNIERKHRLVPAKSLLLVRIVPDIFLLHPFEDIGGIFEAPLIESSGKKNGNSVLWKVFLK